jgi:cellulose synthase/poly-beta-1,6-N-acetylglucosamine synthase-like glycosyltransferase
MAAAYPDLNVTSVPFLVDSASHSQRRQYRGLVCAWIVAQLFFWTWWVTDDHVVTLLGMFINSFLLVWTTFLPAWFLFFLNRVKQTNPALALPEGRVAMIVTKASSEPWSVVRKTLEAMLDQEFPRPYSVWLADEDPSPTTTAWCQQHGVQVSCRKDVPTYHNASWPRRTRCKEGNLSYFYEAMGGYDNYDFVAQLDADHVPEPSYLAEIIRPFANPAVGYVAGPSICDSNVRVSWAARGRLYAEAAWHGAIQAGYNTGFAPQCIGSHYAVRTTALRQIGGLGPELAEDFSTTLVMNSAGWQGAFALNAIAHGDGPASVADCITQEFQWSRSLVNIFLTLWPSHIQRLPLRLKIQLGFSQVWYFLFSLHMVLAYLLPIVALVSGTPWVTVSLPEFLLRASLPVGVAALTVVWARKQGWLRPAESKVLSWEAILFEYVRWPWMVLGIVHAIVGTLASREFSFRVTPKGATRPRSLPYALLLPYVIIVVAEAGVVILTDRPGDAIGYTYLALVGALSYLVVIAAVLGLQLRENGRSFRMATSARVSAFCRAAPVPLMASVLVAAAFTLRGGAALAAFQSGPASTNSGEYNGAANAVLRQAAAGTGAASYVRFPEERPAVRPVGLPLVWPTEAQITLETITPNFDASEAPAVNVVAAPAATVSSQPAGSVIQPRDLPTDRLVIGAYDPGLQLTDAPLDVEHWFVRQDDPTLMAGAIANARNRRTAMVTVEPWPSARLPGAILDNVAAGKADEQLRQLARVARAAQPQVVVVRWGHEMDLSGLYPWAANNPTLYQLAFRHAVGIFRDEGATNVRWVWSPAGNENALDFYPGDDVVDYVGLTVLGDEQWDAAFGLPPQSFDDVLGPRYQRLEGLGKPMIVAELGVSGPAERQTQWLTAAQQSLARYPLLRAVIYFDDKNPIGFGLSVRPDWRLGPAPAKAFLATTSRA